MDTKTKSLIGFTVMGVAAVLTFLIVRQYSYKQEQMDNSILEKSPVEETEKEVVPEKPKGPTNKSGIEIPKEVYTYQGEITEKKENGFVLKASAIDNAIEEDQVMDIRVDPNTRFVRLVITMPKTEGEKVLTNTEEITLADLEAGESVIITTVEIVVARTGFLAQSVRTAREE